MLHLKEKLKKACCTCHFLNAYLGFGAVAEDTNFLKALIKMRRHAQNLFMEREKKILTSYSITLEKKGGIVPKKSLPPKYSFLAAIPH